jgi:hypothetical protein
MRYFIIIIAVIGSINLSAIEFRTIPSSSGPPEEFFDGTEFTGLEYASPYKDGVLAAFSRRSIYYYSDNDWEIFADIDGKIAGLFTDIEVSGDDIYLYRTRQSVFENREFPGAFYKIDNNRELDSIDIPWDNFTGISEFGYYRWIEDFSVGPNGELAILAGFFVRKDNDVSVNGFTEILVLDREGNILNYYRETTDKWTGYDTRPGFPFKGSGSSVFDEIVFRDNGDIVITQGTFQITEGDVYTLPAGTDQWTEEPINYVFQNGAPYTPIEMQDVAGNLYINHYTTSPITGTLFEKSGSDWRSYGNLFGDVLPAQPDNEEYDNFRTNDIFEHNGDIFVSTFGYGIIKLGDSSFETYPIIYEGEDNVSFYVSAFIKAENSLWAYSIAPGTTFPALIQIDPAGLTESSVEEGVEKSQRIAVSTHYYDTMGNELTEKDIQSGILYLELTKYKDGGFKVEKRVVR